MSHESIEVFPSKKVRPEGFEPGVVTDFNESRLAVLGGYGLSELAKRAESSRECSIVVSALWSRILELARTLRSPENSGPLVDLLDLIEQLESESSGPTRKVSSGS